MKWGEEKQGGTPLLWKPRDIEAGHIFSGEGGSAKSCLVDGSLQRAFICYKYLLNTTLGAGYRARRIFPEVLVCVNPAS